MCRKTLGVLVGVVMFGVIVASRSVVTVNAAPPATITQAAAAQDNGGYVGADGCKECHTAHYDAWAGTKHAKALGKLSGGDRENEKCLRCHVTGSADMIKADLGKPRFPGVQCENCHGAGAKHVEQAKAKAMVKGAITKTPDEDACTKCHSSESPHYKPFVYVAMKGLIHTVKK